MSILERIKSREFLINLGLFFLSVFILVFLMSFFLRIYTNHGESLTVPAFKGKTMDEVKRLCDEKDLRYEIKDSVFEPNLPKLTVVDQNPKSGAKVKRNRRIYLILNAGKAPKVAMPSIITQPRRQVERILLSNGLIPGTHPEYKHDIMLNGVLGMKVNGHEVRPGEMIEKGSTVEFILGDGGNGGESVSVPPLSGKTLESVKLIFASTNLILGKVDSTTNNVKNTKTAIIVSQNPLAGRKISMGDIVNVVLKDK